MVCLGVLKGTLLRLVRGQKDGDSAKLTFKNQVDVFVQVASSLQRFSLPSHCERVQVRVLKAILYFEVIVCHRMCITSCIK